MNLSLWPPLAAFLQSREKGGCPGAERWRVAPSTRVLTVARTGTYLAVKPSFCPFTTIMCLKHTPNT